MAALDVQIMQHQNYGDKRNLWPFLNLEKLSTSVKATEFQTVSWLQNMPQLYPSTSNLESSVDVLDIHPSLSSNILL